MKLTVPTVLLVALVGCKAKNQNPPDFQSRMTGEWANISNPNTPVFLVYPLTNGGMFVYDSLTTRWHSYSAWLSADRDTLFGRQGCLIHHEMKVDYMPKKDRIIINDAIVLQHLAKIARQPQQ